MSKDTEQRTTEPKCPVCGGKLIAQLKRELSEAQRERDEADDKLRRFSEEAMSEDYLKDVGE